MLAERKPYARGQAGKYGCRQKLISPFLDPGRHPGMLVLTRKSNQSIMIGDDIEVSVLAIVGEKVRIGIQAPRDVPVFRKEVYLEIQDEHAAAAKEQENVVEQVDAALQGLTEPSAE
jgi:carbon storage regulator